MQTALSRSAPEGDKKIKNGGVEGGGGAQSSEYSNSRPTLRASLSGTYGVSKYGSGWKKAVVNQCLEFAVDLVGRSNKSRK